MLREKREPEEAVAVSLPESAAVEEGTSLKTASSETEHTQVLQEDITVQSKFPLQSETGKLPVSAF